MLTPFQLIWGVSVGIITFGGNTPLINMGQHEALYFSVAKIPRGNHVLVLWLVASRPLPEGDSTRAGPLPVASNTLGNVGSPGHKTVCFSCDEDLLFRDALTSILELQQSAGILRSSLPLGWAICLAPSFLRKVTRTQKYVVASDFLGPRPKGPKVLGGPTKRHIRCTSDGGEPWPAPGGCSSRRAERVFCLWKWRWVGSRDTAGSVINF